MFKITFSLAAAILISTTIYAKDFGTFGAVYEIAEKDALQEIQNKVKQTNWSKHINKQKLEGAVKRYRPEGLQQLKTATKDDMFTVDMSHTLEFDITDGKGNLIYPKGYTYNPLQYVNYTRTLVFINGADPKQIEWFTGSKMAKDYNVKLIITNGSYYDLMKKLKRPVFYANQRMIDKFGLRAVPCVVIQNGPVMEVREFAPKKNKG